MSTVTKTFTEDQILEASRFLVDVKEVLDRESYTAASPIGNRNSDLGSIVSQIVLNALTNPEIRSYYPPVLEGLHSGNAMEVFARAMNFADYDEFNRFITANPTAWRNDPDLLPRKVLFYPLLLQHSISITWKRILIWISEWNLLTEHPLYACF